jgi:hypothetical protein
MEGKTGISIFIISFLFLGFLLPLLFYKDIQPNVFTLNIGLCWFIVIYASFRLVSPMYRNKERILEMSFWLFGYVFMGIVPFIQIMANQFPWYGNYSSDTITKSLIIVLIGMLSYEVGLSISISNKNKSAASERPIIFNTRSLFLISAISVIISLFIMIKQNKFHSLFLPRNYALGTDDANNNSLTIIIQQFAVIPLFICLIIGIVMWKNKMLTKRYAYLTVIGLLVINLVLNNPISNARYWFGSVILTICSIWIPWKKGSFFGWCAGYLLIFLLIFPYADLFRNEINPTVEVVKVSDVMTHKGDYDAFQMLANTTEVVQLQGDTHGRQLLGALLFWVPRSIWLDKPLSSGQMVGETLGYKFTNLSCPLWGESYLNFGYAGVIVIFIFYGYISRILQRKYIQSRLTETVTVTKLIVPFLSAYQVFLLRGDLMNGIAYVSGFLVFTILFTLRKEKELRKAYSMSTMIKVGTTTH